MSQTARLSGRWGAHLRQRGAEPLYQICVEAARQPELYLSYGVPDTFQGRFEMLALHLFAVLHRLMRDPGDDPEFARRLSECFVADMDGALREMGVSDLAVPKRMTTLYRSFGGRITAYGAALGEGADALAAAIARNVFPDEPRDRRASDLADYLRSAVDAMRGADLDRLKRGDVSFPVAAAAQPEPSN